MSLIKTLDKINTIVTEPPSDKKIPQAGSARIVGVMVECETSDLPSPLLGRFIHWNETQKPVIEIMLESTRLRYIAETCVPLDHIKPHDQLMIMVPHNTKIPVIMGILQDNTKPTYNKNEPTELVLEASNKIIFKCGDSKMTLQKDGKVTLRGKNVISHASHRNRVRGGSVELN